MDAGVTTVRVRVREPPPPQATEQSLHAVQADTAQLTGAHTVVPGGQVVVPAMNKWQELSTLWRQGPWVLPTQAEHKPLPGCTDRVWTSWPASKHAVEPAGQKLVPGK